MLFHLLWAVVLVTNLTSAPLSGAPSASVCDDRVAAAALADGRRGSAEWSTRAVAGGSATQVRLTDVRGTESVWSLADLFSSAGFRLLTQPRDAASAEVAGGFSGRGR
jgi:hypothetical protein